MAALTPSATIYDLISGQAIAHTQMLTEWEVGWGIDAIDTLKVGVPSGEHGDGTMGFVDALLRAVGGPTRRARPVPSLVTFSLSNGDEDGIKIIENPATTLAADKLTVVESGDSAYTLYVQMGAEHPTYTDIQLWDVLNAAPGTIIPLDPSQYGFISPTGTLPRARGLLQVTPGGGGWAGASLVTYRAVVASAVKDLPVYLESRNDYVSRAVEKCARRVGGQFLQADAIIGVPQGYRGHWVADSSAAPLNLSNSVT